MKSKGKPRKKKVPKYFGGGLLLGEAINMIKMNDDKAAPEGGGKSPLEAKGSNIFSMAAKQLGGVLGPLAGILGSVGLGAFNAWKQQGDYQALAAMRERQNILDKTTTANNGEYELGGGIDPPVNKSPKANNQVPYNVYNPVAPDYYGGRLHHSERFSTEQSYPYDAMTPFIAEDMLSTINDITGMDMLSGFKDKEGVIQKTPLMDKIQSELIDYKSKIKYTGAKAGGLKVSMEEGGFIKGKTYELSESQIDRLKNLGYKIRYEED